MTPEEQFRLDDLSPEAKEYWDAIGGALAIVVPDERDRLTLRRLLKKIGPALRGFFMGRGVPS